MREEGDHRLGDREFQHTLDATQLLAVACYQVTFDERYKHLFKNVDEVSDSSDEGEQDEEAEFEIIDEDWETPVVRSR
jgi:hypothetical protein